MSPSSQQQHNVLLTMEATRKRNQLLSTALLDKMTDTTQNAVRCCEMITRRARQLDSLTSPASDASSMLSRANANLAATLLLMKDAREKFDTIKECEPAIERLDKAVRQDLDDTTNNNKNEDGATAAAGKRNKKDKTTDNKKKTTTTTSSSSLKNRVVLTEQDVYSAGDSMEILRDAYNYFSPRGNWRSAPNTLSALERLHTMGMQAMGLLIHQHLTKAGQAVRPKRHQHHANKQLAKVPPAEETAEQTRQRLAQALMNRDLLKSIGEFEEFQPIEARPIREIRAIFDCLGSHGYKLGPIPKREPVGLQDAFNVKVNRTEKVGSGSFCNLLKMELKTGFPQLDAYGEARKSIAYAAMDTFYRRIKQDRKRKLEKLLKQQADQQDAAGLTAAELRAKIDEADAAARDAVRCLEHAMVVTAGEKSVYRTIVTPSLMMRGNDPVEDDDDEEETSPFFKKACVGAYAHVVGAVVDRTLDIIETVFLKEGGIGQTSGSKNDKGAILTVRKAASAAAAGLRMLDGVRMLGPSLAKLCEMVVGDGQTDPNSSIAAALCIAIHRTTVKNAARTLENLAKAIQDDPLKGPLHRPKDASVSTVSSDVIFTIRLVSPFVSAYKSVSKRRALPWDPNLGEEAGELDSFVRYLVMRLFNSLKGKALNYTKDGRDDSQAKSNLFLLNNAFYLLEELGPNSESNMGVSTEAGEEDKEQYRIEGTWFVDKVKKLMESEKQKYLLHWEVLNTHLTAVASSDLEYQKNDSNMLSHDSGRLIKQRFTGFNEDFERTYALHRKLCVIDPRLRLELQQDVTKNFLPRYRRFYEKYTKIRFSKKHQDDYTKYSPDKIEEMLSNLYVDPE